MLVLQKLFAAPIELPGTSSAGIVHSQPMSLPSMSM